MSDIAVAVGPSSGCHLDMLRRSLRRSGASSRNGDGVVLGAAGGGQEEHGEALKTGIQELSTTSFEIDIVAKKDLRKATQAVIGYTATLITAVAQAAPGITLATPAADLAGVKPEAVVTEYVRLVDLFRDKAAKELHARR